MVVAAAISQTSGGQNSSWMGDFIRQYQHIHIRCAVAIEDKVSLFPYCVADQKTLSQIAAENETRRQGPQQNCTTGQNLPSPFPT